MNKPTMTKADTGRKRGETAGLFFEELRRSDCRLTEVSFVQSSPGEKLILL
jgi:hypothetical protein